VNVPEFSILISQLEWIAAQAEIRQWSRNGLCDTGRLAEEHNVLLEFIKPGRPMQNGFVKRFNRSYREAVLDMFVFQSLLEVREQT
jgi:transposase InsO family protein